MRPTGRRRSGPREQPSNISGRKRIATRCERALGINRVRYRIAGLSLIELLVVLTIIAAISALITTSVLSALKQQNQRICLNNMLTIEAAKDEYIRDHPGATTIDQTAFQQYFRFGIPTCPDRGDYNNLYNLTEQLSCSVHGKIPVSPSQTP